MEWQQIIGFYHVARLGSFTKAAEATFRTQSALTHQVKALEKELDCLLFERIGKRKILLTAAGRKLFDFAETLLQKYNFLLEDLNEIRTLKKGSLKIAAPFTTLYHLLPVPLKRFTKKFPWVDLTILDRPQRQVLQLAKDGDIDFGIVLESPATGDLASVRWLEAHTVLIAAKGHPLTKEKKVSMDRIVQYPLILPPKEADSQARRRLDELFAELGLQYRVIMETSNVELSSVYCQTGLGVSFATIVKNLPARARKDIALIPLADYFKPEHIAIVMRKDKILASFKQAFLDLVLEKIER